MSSYGGMSQADQAAAYERHISDNWDRLSSWEQEQAKAYMQAKYTASQGPGYSPGQGQAMPYAYGGQYQTASYGPAGYGYDPIYGGYGPGAFGPPRKEKGGGWAVPVGYVGLLICSPVAIACGIKNIVSGRTGHGYAQLILGIFFLVIGILMVTSGP